MNRFRANASTSGLLLLCLVAAGCDGTTARTRSGQIQIKVDRITEQADLVVVRAHVSFRGERKVHLWQEGDSETFTIQPDSKTGLAEGNVLLVADLVNAGTTRQVKWLHAIQSAGGKAGGPSTYTVEKDAKLADLLTIQLQSGDYPLGQEIEIATFRGQPLRLKIE